MSLYIQTCFKSYWSDPNHRRLLVATVNVIFMVATTKVIFTKLFFEEKSIQ